AALAMLIVVMALLGYFGLIVGFDVSWIGEDNTWIDILRRGEGSEAARISWAIDNRNPLSPWWYIVARPVILGFDNGLLLLRYAMALVLALSAYYMVLMVAGNRSRSFALGLAITIVLWMASRYSDQ